MNTAVSKRVCCPLALFILAVLFSCLHCHAALAAPGSGDPALPSASNVLLRLIIADDTSYAPFVFLDADSRPAGNTVDIWKLWRSKTSIPVDSPVSWAAERLFAAGIVALLALAVLWNIHLRKTVAKALRQVEQRNRELHDSETRLKTFFDLAPFSCFVNDLQGRFRMVNKAFCSRTGLREEEVLGRTEQELGLFFNQNLAAEILAELKRTGEVVHRETMFNAPEGPRHALFSSRLMDLDGKKLILSSAVDITDRKQAEAALQESEQRFSKAFSLSPAPMVISDIRTGRFIDVNEQWLRMLEHTRKETIGRTSYEQGIWEDPDIRTRLGKLMQEKGSFRDEPIRFITKSGAVRDALWSAEKINLGGSEVMLSLIYDFTERKMAEDALRESESYNKMLFHDAHIPLAVLDPQTGRFIDANQAALRIYGLSDDIKLLGKQPEDVSAPLQYDGRPSQIAAAEKIRQAFEHGFVIFEWRHQRPDGTFWDAEVHLVSFTHRSRQLMQLSLQDITGRKEAESERAKMQHQLLQSQKMESIGRLAGGVAHDFNNMLSVILGHVELAMKPMKPTHPLFSRLQNIRKAAERSAALTGQLLAFARKQTVTPKVLHLNETVGGMLNMLRRLIGENIDLVWIPGSDQGAIKIDPSQLDQILVNLCVNGRDAIGDTGAITIETDTTTLDETACIAYPGALPGEYARLTVSDNGCGMDPETLSHLFEPFFTTKQMGQGTGLGLATTYGIVRQNNGFINVYSEPGQGSTFRIYLPRHTPITEQKRKTAAASPAACGIETILVVEDEPMILDITTTMLELQGYKILAAATPGEALRLAREQAGTIHLLMTDVVMPEMNGRDLAEKLLVLYPDLKLLFMSGYTANVIAHHGVLDEGVHFIQKPFALKDLAAQVREALDTVAIAENEEM